MNLIRESLAVVVLAALGLVTVMAGATSASAIKRVHGLHEFQSPSTNIGCEISKHFVRCDINAREWQPPKAPASCMLDYGQGLAVGHHGKGYFVCAGDTALDPQAKKLGYGDTIRDGGSSCTSTTTGITCRNRKTGHGLFISKESYRRF